MSFKYILRVQELINDEDPNQEKLPIKVPDAQKAPRKWTEILGSNDLAALNDAMKKVYSFRFDPYTELQIVTKKGNVTKEVTSMVGVKPVTAK